MVQTFKELQDKVLRQLDEAGDTDTTLALVKDGLNLANRNRVTKQRWPFMLWEPTQVFSTVSGSQNYTLHPEFFWPNYFYNRTQQRFMKQVQENNLVESGADWINDHDFALHFVLWGKSEVAAQPSAASVVTIASSNAGDNGKGVIIRGDTTDGVRSETIVVGASGSVQFTKILKVTKVETTWIGTLTLTAGTVTLLKLFPEEFGRVYQNFRLLQVTDSAEVIEYSFYRQPSALTQDNDRPDVPAPFEDILVYDTLLGFAAYNRYDTGTVKIWMKQLDDLEKALRDAYASGTAVEAQASYTTYIPR